MALHEASVLNPARCAAAVNGMSSVVTPPAGLLHAQGDILRVGCSRFSYSQVLSEELWRNMRAAIFVLCPGLCFCMSIPLVWCVQVELCL